MPTVTSIGIPNLVSHTMSQPLLSPAFSSIRIHMLPWGP